ncbi:MAG: threonine ammonia-lyase [Thermodesulfovibrionales bacterium]|nr:threonine ammonia-lyase [Thermodesulfovibrionales bacterium]
MVTIDGIRKAREAIGPYIDRTPLLHSDSISSITGAEVYVKCENLQHTGSFKPRGAFNKLISLGKVGKAGKQKVIAASMGNHAQGVAFAASALGLSAKIVMPESAPIAKQLAVRGYGGELQLKGTSLMEAIDHALTEKGHAFIHPFDDEQVIHGQGTVGLEILDELDSIDSIIVPVGGGGLIAGIATAVKAISPSTRVIGVQASAARSAMLSLEKGEIVDDAPSATMADGIAVGRMGDLPFRIASEHVDAIYSVDEGRIAHAMLTFLERKRLVIEGAGAVSLACLLEHQEDHKGKRVVLIASGGNMDLTLMDKIIMLRLKEHGRLTEVEVVVPDVPGTLSNLTGAVASLKGNILHVLHDRLARDMEPGLTLVRLNIETSGPEHSERITEGIKAAGFKLKKYE